MRMTLHQGANDIASCQLLNEPPWNATKAGQPIFREDSINQIRFGCNIHQLFQLVNVLLASKYCGSAAHLLTTRSYLRPGHRKTVRIKLNIGSMNRILAGGNTLKALSFTRSMNRAVRVVFRSYLITLSVRYSTDCGIVRPICLAAFRLIMNSNFIGCSTGRSPGLTPFKILST